MHIHTREDGQVNSRDRQAPRWPSTGQADQVIAPVYVQSRILEGLTIARWCLPACPRVCRGRRLRNKQLAPLKLPLYFEVVDSGINMAPD